MILIIALTVSIWALGTLYICRLDLTHVLVSDGHDVPCLCGLDAAATGWRTARSVCRRVAQILLVYPIPALAVYMLQRPNPAWRLACAVTEWVGLVAAAMTIAVAMIALGMLTCEMVNDKYAGHAVSVGPCRLVSPRLPEYAAQDRA